jgi:tetratricopeptide (TPR) repeat protein
MTFLVLKNQFDDATALYESLKPLHYPWLDEPFGLALYGKGELEKARAVLGNFSKKSGMHGLIGFTTGREWLADIDLYQGRISEATSEIELLLTSDSQYGSGSHYLYLARVNALLSNQENARIFALKSVSLADTRDTRIEAAAILSCAGRQRDVLNVLQMGTAQAIANLTPSTEHFIDGCKALIGHDYGSAIRELQASEDIDDDIETELFLTQAYIGAKQWKDARGVLEDLQASKGRIIADQNNPPVIWALAHYYLGDVCEATGDRQCATANYTKFLDIWKDADPNLKLVIDAKQRLAHLASAL